MRFSFTKKSTTKKSARHTLPSDVAIIQIMVIPAFVLDQDRRAVVWNKVLEGLTGERPTT